MIPLSSSSQCIKCNKLISDIRKQIGAFKILSSVSDLNWAILVQNIEEILGQSEGEDVGPLIENGNVDLKPILSSLPPLPQNISNPFQNGLANDLHDQPFDQLPILPRVNKSKKVNLYSFSETGITPAKLQMADEHLKSFWRNGKIDFQCQICTRPLHNRREARLHVRRVHYKDRYQCDRCPKQLYDRKEMNLHVGSCEGRTKKEKLIWKERIIEKQKMMMIREENESKIISIPKQEITSRKIPQKIIERRVQNRQKSKIMTLDLDKIIVRNPFEKFNLQHALSAHVKLERLNLPPDQIWPSKKKGRPLGSTKRKRKGIRFQPRKRSNQVNPYQKSILNKVFRQRKLNQEKPQQQQNSPKKLRLTKNGKPWGRPKKMNESHPEVTNLTSNEDFMETHVPEPNLEEYKENGGPIHDLHNSVSDLETQEVKMDSEPVESAGNFLTNFDYEAVQYRDFPEMILNQLSSDPQNDFHHHPIAPLPLLPVPVQEVGLLTEFAREIQILDEELALKEIPIPVADPEIIQLDPPSPSALTSLTPLNVLTEVKEEPGQSLDAEPGEEPEAVSELTPSQQKSSRANLEVDSKIFMNSGEAGEGAIWGCMECPKIFTNVTNCRRHVRTVHLKERTSLCPCGKSFSSDTILRRHAITCKKSANT